MALAYLALAWLLGVAAAAWADGDWWAVVAAAVVFGAASVVWRARARQGWGLSPRTIVLFSFGISAVLVGGWRYASVGGADVSLERLNGSDVTIRAVVSEEPTEGEAGMVYRLDVRGVFEDGAWREASGKVLMTAAIAPRYEYGDLLEVRGDLDEPPVFPDFNYRDYLLRQGIVSIVSHPKVSVVEHDQGSAWRAGLIDVRERLSGALSDVLPEPHASLAAGILFGSRSRIPDELRDDMRTTGTSHLVAVSGQNVTIVAAMLIAALAWVIGRRQAAFVSLAAIAGYAVLVGGQPSVVRAAAMGAVYIVAIVSGRQNTGWAALGLVAAIMTAIEPRVIDEISFQLSFAATLGLTTLAGPLREQVESLVARWPAAAGFPLTRPMSELASVTVAAILFTLPITALNFGQVSLAAPVANVFVVPAFLAVAATAGVAAVLGLIGLGSVGTWIAWPAAEYMVQSVRLFASVPGASMDFGVPLWIAIVWYAVLLGGTLRLMGLRVPTTEPPKLAVFAGGRRLLPASGMALLIVMASVFGWLWLNQPERGRLSVTVMDVGQGDAILIEGPSGNRVLVDGGPASGAINEALGRNLPFDDRRIDLVAVSHAQADHLGGLLEVVREYDVRAVMNSPKVGESALYDAWVAELRDAQVTVTAADRGQTIDLGGGATLQVLTPDAEDVLLPAYDLNEASLVLRLTMGEVSFLLTGDLDENGEAQLIRSGADLSATVLKVGHHGSRTSTSEAFLTRVDPLVDVISVARANRFGHPTDEVLGRLSGDLVLRTDVDGDVRIETDGVRVWVER
jgi:competence protein ComEC